LLRSADSDPAVLRHRAKSGKSWDSVDLPNFRDGKEQRTAVICRLRGAVIPLNTLRRSSDWRRQKESFWEERPMVTLFVRHTVSDYKTWRKFYDNFAPIQKAKGVEAEAVYQAADNPSDITVTHDFATREAAQAFVKSEELKKAMQNAGVVGAPTIWITNKA
jgi:hypothetical protein